MLHILVVIGLILLILWALGLVSGRTLGGGIHALLVIGFILIILWLIFEIL